jgi:hypothetical protein
VRLTTLPPTCELVVLTMWGAHHLTTLSASTAFYRDSFTFLNVVKIAITFLYSLTDNSRTFL